MQQNPATNDLTQNHIMDDLDFWMRRLKSSKRGLSPPPPVYKLGVPIPVPSEIDPVDTVMSEQTVFLPEVAAHTNQDHGYDTLYPWAAGSAGLLLLLLTGTALITTRCRQKCVKNDSEAASILVYPSKQGTMPHFLSKEIHFSLPPLRSSSLSDLMNGENDDSESEISESLLMPTAHSKRSNSFSSYGLGIIEPALYRSTLELDEWQWPEGHLGRMWFSLRYEPATEKLLVSLLKAKNLPSRTVGTVSSCDPFVRLHLLPDERRFLQSKQKKKTCNPYFDETLVFQVSAKDMMDHLLKLTVIDAGRTKRRQELGHVTVPLRDLDMSDNSEQQLFKMDLEKEAQETISDLGELLVSLLYNENLKRLTVTVIEARRLKLQGDKRELYVKVTLNQQYRVVKEKKTQISKERQDGSIPFSEGFHLRIPPAQLDTTSVAFHVFQSTAGYGRPRLLGKCVLGSFMFARGKALAHWNAAVQNPMEQVQHWHSLSE